MSINVVKLQTNEPQKYNLSAECANSTWLRLESSNTKSSALLFQAFSQWTNLTLSYRSNLHNISQHVNGTAVGLIKVRSFYFAFRIIMYSFVKKYYIVQPLYFCFRPKTKTKTCIFYV